MLRAAKETISLAEQRLLEDDKRQFDSAWQEMLNHATQRVIQKQSCLPQHLSFPHVFFLLWDTVLVCERPNFSVGPDA